MVTNFYKALLNFIQFIDAVMITFTESVIENMTTNPHFVTPSPSIASLQSALDTFSAAVTAAANRDRAKVAEKRTARKALIAVLRALCGYVNMVANGSSEIIDTSGYQTSKTREQRYIYAPTNLQVMPGINPATLQGVVDSVKGKTGYRWDITPMPITADSVWTSFNSTRRKFLFEKLESRRQYAVRVAALGSNNQEFYSTIIMQSTL